MPVAEKCTKILEQFGVSYQLRVASAHRSPAFVEQIVHDAEADGCHTLRRSRVHEAKEEGFAVGIGRPRHRTVQAPQQRIPEEGRQRRDDATGTREVD